MSKKYVNVLNYANGARVRYACGYNTLTGDTGTIYNTSSKYYKNDYGWTSYMNGDWYPQSSLAANDLENTVPPYQGLTLYRSSNVALVAGISPYPVDEPTMSYADTLEVSYTSSDGNCRYVEFYTSNCETVEEANEKKDFEYWDTLEVSAPGTPVQKKVKGRGFMLLYVKIYGGTQSYIEIGYIKAFGTRSVHRTLVQESGFKYLDGDTWKTL